MDFADLGEQLQVIEGGDGDANVLARCIVTKLPVVFVFFSLCRADIQG